MMNDPSEKKAVEERSEKKSRRLLACFCHETDAEPPPEIIAADPKVKGHRLKIVPSLKKRLPFSEMSWSSSNASSRSIGSKSRRRLSGIKAAIFGGSTKGSSGWSDKEDQAGRQSTRTRDGFDGETSAASSKSLNRRSRRLLGSSDSICSESSSFSTETCSSSSSTERSTASLDFPAMPSAETLQGKPFSSFRRIQVRKAPINPAQSGADGVPTKRTAPMIAGLCYVIAIGLATSLIWGKIPAVLFTAVWCYLTRRQNPSANARGRFPPQKNHHGRVARHRSPLM